MLKSRVAMTMTLSAMTFLGAGCAQQDTVSYASQVKPILEANCLECHRAGGEAFEASGFSMETYADLMKGTNYGAMVVPGDPLGSNILVLMEGRADPSISMPHGDNPPVSEKDIGTIRSWIEQGAANN